MNAFGLPILEYLRDSGRKTELSIQKYIKSICFLHIHDGNIDYLVNRAINKLSVKGYIIRSFYWEITSEGAEYLNKNEKSAAEWLVEEQTKYEMQYLRDKKSDEARQEEERRKSEEKKQIEKENGRNGKIKGDDGEERTYNLLSKGKIQGYHKVIKNAFLTGVSGRTVAEIDILVLSTHGIFVIENKEYSGKIKVSNNKKNLSLVTQKNKNQQSTNRVVLRNALSQNTKHVNFITSKLHVSVKAIYSIVVLPETVKGPNCWESMPHVFVVKRLYLIKKINEIIENSPPLWETYEVDKMAEDLLSLNGSKAQNPYELTQEKTRDSIRM